MAITKSLSSQSSVARVWQAGVVCRIKHSHSVDMFSSPWSWVGETSGQLLISSTAVLAEFTSEIRMAPVFFSVEIRILPCHKIAQYVPSGGTNPHERQSREMTSAFSEIQQSLKTTLPAKAVSRQARDFDKSGISKIQGWWHLDGRCGSLW